MLCNDAHLLDPEDGGWPIVGDPMEAALLVVAAQRGHTGRAPADGGSGSTRCPSTASYSG